MMSFSNYNVRHSNLTSRESFSTYSKQQNSSMMYRGSQFSDVSFEIRSLYSTGTRTVTPSSRTATRMARAKNISTFLSSVTVLPFQLVLPGRLMEKPHIFPNFSLPRNSEVEKPAKNWIYTPLGKSSESVQCTMLKACDTCEDMGQL